MRQYATVNYYTRARCERILICVVARHGYSINFNALDFAHTSTMCAFVCAINVPSLARGVS